VNRLAPPSSDPGPITEREWESLARFRRELRRFLRFSEAAARASGLTPQQHQLLLALRGAPGRAWLSVSELADALQESHHGVVGLVDRLERRGLVVRQPHAPDRRTVEVHLTPAGEALLVRLTLAHRAELARMRDVFEALVHLSDPPPTA
jgi:DNA-binding MarR family transcriptional regulator